MDLENLKYQQNFYNYTEESTGQVPQKPHQEVLDLVEKNKNFLYYQEIIKLLSSINKDTDLQLEDGTKIRVIVRDKVVEFGAKLPNGGIFTALWSNAANQEEFNKAISS